MEANIDECVIKELPEDKSKPESIVVSVTNLIFDDIPTLISNVQFELMVGEKSSLHSRQKIIPSKKCPANSFIHE